ncbi:MAG TPA: hypothetical protein PKM97_06615 [Bacteroidia bacterium]|nr:hypothetical protein [Bacteroidia bacterium]
MKTKIDWGRSKRMALQISIGLVFLISLGFTDSRQSRMKCSELVITIVDTLGHSFVEPEDIRLMVLNKFGELKGQQLSSINIALLEKIIANNAFIAEAEVFSCVDGKLNIEVLQRKPVVRVVNFNQESFYIDDKGVFMPLSEKYTARVPLANGYIFQRASERQVDNAGSTDVNSISDSSVSIMKSVYDVASFINQDDFWNAQVEQIYVNAKGDIELIPRVGGHNIILGNGRDLNDKFSRLFLFYTDGLSKSGWDKYKTINLKFKDQVVCTKK